MRAPGRRRSARILRGLLLSLLAASLLWVTGLLWFGATLPTTVSEPERRTDAIVVLTGGSGRLGQGLELLAAHRAEKLFVSGVYRGVEVEELLVISQQSPEELQCCIALGYEADNTRGNAIESAAWIAEQGYRSLRLVTATYHMPRSLLEFRRAMPEIEIVPHPVFPPSFKQSRWFLWPGSAALVASEYAKYLLALARAPFDRLGT
jgi:uncharacterized SAM-binding protein YcdF (DUF218 family)